MNGIQFLKLSHRSPFQYSDFANVNLMSPRFLVTRLVAWSCKTIISLH
jgi:hypothetical protein